MYIAAGLFNILLKQFEDVQVNISPIFMTYKTDLKTLENPIAKIDANIFGQYLELVVIKKDNYRLGLESGLKVAS